MSGVENMPSETPRGREIPAKAAALSRHLPLAAFFLFAAFPLPAVLLFTDKGVFAVLSVIAACLGLALLFHRSSTSVLRQEAAQLRNENAELINSLSEEKLAAKQSHDAAQASARAKSAFIANISHEIRTPLNALLGMAQLLERAGLEKPHRDYVKIMLEAGRGLRTLLDDVIALARDDSGNAEAADCDAGVAVRSVAQLLQPYAWEKRLRLDVSVPANLPRVAADPRRVRQILLKLADNALKFTDAGAVHIAVETVADKNGKTHMRFSVSDTGHGIPPEAAPHLFEPFAPGDGSYTRKHQGAGLGLAVVKRVVEQIRGSIGFESEPGQGSTFWFELPTAESREISKPQFLDISGDMHAPSNLSLLVFLREPKVTGEIAKLLEPFGNRVLRAYSHSEAAARASREQFDAIIADARDVELLAAVPGRRTPLLALIFSGDRPPASGDEALQWPTRPREFYGVLHRLSEATRTVPVVEKPKSEVPPIDANTFAALEKSLGRPTLLEILHSYIKTAEGLCEALTKASAEANWNEAGRIAQDMAGAAGGLGFAAMTTAARQFVARIRETYSAHSLRNDAQMLIGEHVRVCSALTDLYPDLTA